MAIIDIGTVADGFIRPLSVQYTTDKTGAGDSDTIVIPPGAAYPLSVKLRLRSAGTAKIQWTLTPRGTVKAGGTVYWEDWDAGDCTATTTAMCGPVSALKIVVTTGNWSMDIASC